MLQFRNCTSRDGDLMRPAHSLPVGEQPFPLLIICRLRVLSDVIIKLLIIQFSKIFNRDKSHFLQRDLKYNKAHRLVFMFANGCK